ncbi:MAG: hypothetical protein ACI9LU_000821 [Polaribacter sp.]|jgi:hypothetical protein
MVTGTQTYPIQKSLMKAGNTHDLPKKMRFATLMFARAHFGDILAAMRMKG